MSFEKTRKLKNPPMVLTEQNGLYRVVRSRAGRDRGKLFVVVGLERDKYGKLFAALADGARRTVSKPKRKRASQLECVSAEGVLSKERVSDESLRDCLGQFGKQERFGGI